jgi:DNA-binding MarR family transcriptional regulator
VADKSLAKAFKRKIGLDEGILPKVEAKRGESSLLMNPSRRKIFEYICNFPCSHLRAIARATDYSPQTVRWHLGKLMQGGLISEHAHGGKKLYSPLKNIIEPEECGVLAILNREDIRNTFLSIEKRPNQTQKELCKALDSYQQILSRVLLSLENSDLITYEKVGREKGYFVTPKVREIEEAFTSKSKTFEIALMEALEADSLNPSIESSNKNHLSIKLDIGGGKGPILKINKNPFTTLLRGR